MATRGAVPENPKRPRFQTSLPIRHREDVSGKTPGAICAILWGVEPPPLTPAELAAAISLYQRAQRLRRSGVRLAVLTLDDLGLGPVGAKDTDHTHLTNRAKLGQPI